MKKNILVILLLLLLNSITYDNNINALTIEEVIYEVTTDDSEWASFNSLDEMLNICQVDEKKLESMTTDEVLVAVLDFPLVVNLFLYNTEEEGRKQLELQSDAYTELLKRKDRYQVLSSRYLAKSARTKNIDNLDDMVIEVLMRDKEILKKSSSNTTITNGK